MKVAILGGGSCFAMNLARYLVDEGHNVLSISRSLIRPAPFTLALETEDRFTYRQAHLLNQLDRTMGYLDEFMPEMVVNFTALCEVGESWNHAEDYFQTNVIAHIRLCEELRKRSYMARFVQVGSSEVYGSVNTPAVEDGPLNCSSPYAASKAAFDLHLISIALHQAFPAVIVRPSNGYCEGQTLNRIMPKTIISALNGTRLKLQGGGAARKSYLHGDDISKGIFLVGQHGRIGEVYNCGPLVSTSIKEVVETLAAMMGKTLSEVADVAPERVGQDSQYLLDSHKISDLGWRQEISLEDGYLRMINWVKRYPELLTMDQSYTHRQ